MKKKKETNNFLDDVNFIEPLNKMTPKKEKQSYKDLLKKPQWQRKRLEIMNRDNFTCKYCGDDQNELQIHHLKYTGMPWEAKDEDLKTSCCHCHQIITEYKDNNLISFYKDKFVKVYHVDGKIIIFNYIYNEVAIMFDFNSKVLESILKYKNGYNKIKTR